MSKDTGNINNIQEGQGELFSEFQGARRNKFAHLKKEMALGKKMALNISYENLALFFIILIMLIVIFFSIGVERGKRAAIEWAVTHANKINSVRKNSALFSTLSNGVNKQEQVLPKVETKSAQDTSLKPYAVPRKIAKPR